MESLRERISALEKRVTLLEAGMHGDHSESVYIELSTKYGLYVNKTEAARIIGMNRATIYTMLKDGRLKAGCGGRSVSVKSIAAYLSKEKTDEQEDSGVNDEE